MTAPVPARLGDDELADALDHINVWFNGDDRALQRVRNHIVALTVERDRALHHDTQDYPTAWAYEQACRALRERDDECDRLRAAETRVRELHREEHASVSAEVWGEPGTCTECRQGYPCATLSALDGPA